MVDEMIPSKDAMRLPHKLVVPAPSIRNWVNDDAYWLFTATAEVAILLTSAAKISCPTAKLLSKVIHSTSHVCYVVRPLIYPPILYKYTCNLTSDFHLYL